MNPLILNRAPGGQTAPTVILGQPSWHQIEVSGEHASSLDGRPITIHIDQAARDSIIALFNRRGTEMDPGDADADMLVDADHLSRDMSHDTRAYSWLKQLRESSDGQIEGLQDWTGMGVTAVNNREFRYFSTEFHPDDLQEIRPGHYRPLRLYGLSLTNRPRHKGGKPIINREDSGADAAPAANPNPNQSKPDMDPTKIAEALGLPPEATEDDILAAIAALADKAAAADAAAADAEAETIMNRFADRIPADKRADWKAALIKNRADTEALLGTLPVLAAVPDPRKPITNRQDAAVPHASRATGAQDEAGAKKRAVVIKNRAEEKFRSGKFGSLTDAFISAQREIDAES